jgi:alpha-N-arabinofuranosidase
MRISKPFLVTLLVAPSVIRIGLGSAAAAPAESNAALPAIVVQADHVVSKMPPTFYGLMTEEINYSYEGGLYGELVRNRSFKADAIKEIIKPNDYDPARRYPVKLAVTNAPKFWDAINADIALDTNVVLNDVLNVSLRVDAARASTGSRAGVANGGYWGIPVRPHTKYRVSFYARAKDFAGPVTLALESSDGQTVFGKATVSGIGAEWKRFEASLSTGSQAPSKSNRLTLTVAKPGTVWLQQVSLFGPTYKKRENGNRVDLSQLLAGLGPKFLRCPGGNYVEGDYFNERFNWKEMVGPQERRPGHRSCWGYWSTDGFGLPEFLGWCQDLNMEPVLAVFAGYTLKKDYVAAGPRLEPYVQEALEEIEYVMGDRSTRWGAQRARDGYPKPFKLRYVEVGNEDWFDRSGSYDGRFAQFYDAIKAKYPQLQVIATTPVKSRVADLIDEHYYESEESMEAKSFMYDSRDRAEKTKIFVGEWATRVGSPTPNMAGALGDAAWMCGMERNADIVLMHCYAPLFVNVSDLGAGRSMQWRTDLIGYDALNSYGSPAYYAQKMFSEHVGDEVLGVSASNLPHYTWQPPARKVEGKEQPLPPASEVKSLFYSATRDTRHGRIILKIVNRADAAQEARLEIKGVKSVAGKGTAIVLKAAKREESNTLADPTHIEPAIEKVDGLGARFVRSFPACSITILEVSATFASQ